MVLNQIQTKQNLIVFVLQNNTVLFSNYLSNGYLNNSKHIFYEQVGIFYMFSVLYNGELSSKLFNNNDNNNC